MDNAPHPPKKSRPERVGLTAATAHVPVSRREPLARTRRRTAATSPPSTPDGEIAAPSHVKPSATRAGEESPRDATSIRATRERRIEDRGGSQITYIPTFDQDGLPIMTWYVTTADGFRIGGSATTPRHITRERIEAAVAAVISEGETNPMSDVDAAVLASANPNPLQ